MGNKKSRMTEDYPSDRILNVNKISRTTLGKELTKQCGNEGMHRDLATSGKTTVRFLQTAISYIDDAVAAGADLSNAAFIFAHLGREFVIKAGDGDWEFFFSEDANDEIRGCCVRKGKTLPWCSIIWNGFKSSYALITGGTVSGSSTGNKTTPVLAITDTENAQ